MKNLVKSAWALVQENRRAYLILNVVYYALVIACMIYVAFDQELQQSLLNEIGAAFLTGPLSFVEQAYINTQVIAAILATFFVNLFIGSLASITLPSLIIPFSGLLVGAYRAILWGLLLSPASPGLRLIMIPHSITLILEGQAYILAMLTAYIQGRAFLWPKSVGLASRARGYLEGLKRTGKLYLLIILTLAVAAIYEVIEVVILSNSFAEANGSMRVKDSPLFVRSSDFSRFLGDSYVVRRRMVGDQPGDAATRAARGI